LVRSIELMRTLAIGDIHGCHVALETVLKHVCVRPTDTVVILGDVIDRGPGTRQVIETLIELSRACSFVFVMGNHEEMFLDSLTNKELEEPWLGFGGLETCLSYGGEWCRMPDDHLDFLRKTVDYFETPSAVLVHANLEPGRALAEQSAEWLRWAKLTKRERPLPSGQRVVCGHTPQKNGIPWVGGGWVCIDTYAYGGEFLTCLDLTNDLVYQARQSGEFRLLEAGGMKAEG